MASIFWPLESKKNHDSNNDDISIGNEMVAQRNTRISHFSHQGERRYGATNKFEGAKKPTNKLTKKTDNRQSKRRLK